MTADAPRQHDHVATLDGRADDLPSPPRSCSRVRSPRWALLQGRPALLIAMDRPSATLPPQVADTAVSALGSPPLVLGEALIQAGFRIGCHRHAVRRLIVRSSAAAST